MQFLYYSLFAAGVLAADQFTKYLSVLYLSPETPTAFLPGILRLTIVHNTGAAFSSFEGQQWLFGLIFLAFTAMMLYEYFRKSMGFTNFERWCIAAVYGGGLGNMLDRIRLGYVVDMMETTFIDFPVFNVADVFITCGCAILGVHLIFFNKQFWKDDKKK